MLEKKEDKELKIWFKEIDDLNEKINQLNNQIFSFDKEQEDEELKMQSTECKIENLREEKNKKDWQLTFLNIITIGFFKFFRNKKLNQQIKNLKRKVKDLKINISEIEKNKYPLKNLKLTILEKINILWRETFINFNDQHHKNTSQKLDQILLNQKIISLTNKASNEIEDNDLYPITKKPFEKNIIIEDEGIYTNSNNSSSEELCFDKEKNNFDYPKKLNPFDDETEKSEIKIVSIISNINNYNTIPSTPSSSNDSTNYNSSSKLLQM